MMKSDSEGEINQKTTTETSKLLQEFIDIIEKEKQEREAQEKAKREKKERKKGKEKIKSKKKFKKNKNSALGYIAKQPKVFFIACDKKGNTPLMLAIKARRPDLTAKIIEKIKENHILFSSFQCCNHRKETPLMLAAYHGDKESVKLIMDALDLHEKETVMFQEQNIGRTAFQLALQEDYVPVAKLLLNYAKNHDNVTYKDKTYREEKYKQGEGLVIQLLLNSDHNNAHSLIIACYKADRFINKTPKIGGEINTLRFLIKEFKNVVGWDINATAHKFDPKKGGAKFRTVIHLIVEDGLVHHLQYLIDEGINPLTYNQLNQSAFHVLAKMGHPDKVIPIWNMLITQRNCADTIKLIQVLDSVDHYGFNVMHYAVIKNHLKLLQVLFLLDIPVKTPTASCDAIGNSKHVTKQTALHLAVATFPKPSLPLIQLLLGKGLSPMDKDEQGKTPYELASAYPDIQNEIEPKLLAKQHLKKISNIKKPTTANKVPSMLPDSIDELKILAARYKALNAKQLTQKLENEESEELKEIKQKLTQSRRLIQSLKQKQGKRQNQQGGEKLDSCRTGFFSPQNKKDPDNDEEHRDKLLPHSFISKS